MCECVTPECDTDACVYASAAVVCLFFFFLLLFPPLIFPGHTHTQLLSVSMLSDRPQNSRPISA